MLVRIEKHFKNERAGRIQVTPWGLQRADAPTAAVFLILSPHLAWHKGRAPSRQIKLLVDTLLLTFNSGIHCQAEELLQQALGERAALTGQLEGTLAAAAQAQV